MNWESLSSNLFLKGCQRVFNTNWITTPKLAMNHTISIITIFYGDEHRFTRVTGFWAMSNTKFETHFFLMIDMNGGVGYKEMKILRTDMGCAAGDEGRWGENHSTMAIFLSSSTGASSTHEGLAVARLDSFTKDICDSWVSLTPHFQIQVFASGLQPIHSDLGFQACRRFAERIWKTLKALCVTALSKQIAIPVHQVDVSLLL